MKKLQMALAAVISAVVTFNASADYTVEGTTGDNAATITINGTPYTWYKFVLTDSIEKEGQTSVYINEVGLYDKEGNRRNKELRYAEPGSQATLSPGFACWDSVLVNQNQEYLPRVFDDDSSTYDKDFARTGKSAPKYSDDNTWYAIIMRLPEDSAPVASFDVLPYDENRFGNRRFLTGYQLLGSSDGDKWDLLSDQKDKTPNNGNWASSNQPFVSGATHMGFPIAGYESGEFVLSGEAGTVGEIKDIDVLYKHFSMRKTGAGTWTLSGKQKFSGELKVESGTLVLQPVPSYTWYKFVLTDSIESTGQTSVYINEVGLYDKDGKRQNKGLEYAAPGSQATLLPGSACWDSALVDQNPASLPQVFDDDSSTFNNFARTSKPAPKYADDNTWYAIVMRLPEGTAPVTSFDVLPYDENKFGNRRFLTGYRLMGSLDGSKWDLLSDQKDRTPDNGNWASSNQPFEAGVAHTGFSVSAYTADYDISEFLSDVKAISVASGARLETASPLVLDRLTLSSSNGTYAGFTFAEEGVIEIDSSTPKNCVVNFEGCDAVANLAKWQVKANGVLKKNWWVEVVPGGLRVCCKGLFLVVR